MILLYTPLGIGLCPRDSPLHFARQPLQVDLQISKQRDAILANKMLVTLGVLWRHSALVQLYRILLRLPRWPASTPWCRLS